jgi:hypothetical protein
LPLLGWRSARPAHLQMKRKEKLAKFFAVLYMQGRFPLFPL